MTERFQDEYRIAGITETRDEFTNLATSVDDLDKEFKKHNRSATATANSFNEITDAVKKIREKIVAVASGIASMAQEFERQNAILNRFNGNVSEAAERTNGLITQLDLITASATAMQAGLQFTATEFANISVAASEFAAATGTDATEALDRLVRAIAQGEEGALREFGISLGEAKTQTERQDAAIRDLTQRYGGMESQADTLAGKLQVLENRMADATTELIRALEQTGSLDRAFDSLEGSVDDLADAFSGLEEDPLSAMEKLAIEGGAFIEALAGEFEDLTRFVVAARNALVTLGEALLENGGSIENAFRNDEVLGAFAELGVAEIQDQNVSVRDRQARIAQENRQRIEKERQLAQERQGQGGNGGNRRESERLEEVNKLEIERKAEIEEQLRLQEEQAENDTLKLEAASRLLELEKERAEIAERQADALAKQKQLLIEQIAEEQRLQEEATQREKKLGRVQDEADALEERRIAITERSQAGFEGLLEIGFEVSRLTRESNQSIGQAFKTAIDEWLKSFATQSAFSAVRELALGIGTSIANPPEAATHFSSAAVHGALAAAAGGASAAIPNAGGGGGGGGGASRPEATGGGGGGGGGGQVNIYINNPVARSEAGREIARADKASRNRFGR